ncbi:hypothetical protein LHJ74_30845 [Streptomyces sp. N2-109]|uniref:Uncharacterized protein n=1 Tax=Streptomyces gossypii TaxID=2883101 RepID=A0ABT2K257_9ACTN|nr:hypothetical protein [Streptomyces gossypii]MCT2594255.1 hypothetical protein [Streptomyces gossypii]
MSANKDKGTRHETAVVNYLNKKLGRITEDGRFKWPIDSRNIKRQAQTGRKDVGDIWAYPFILEAKDEARHSIPSYIRQANQEALNAGTEYGAAVVKKRGANIADSYVCMDLRTFARVLESLRRP